MSKLYRLAPLFLLAACGSDSPTTEFDSGPGTMQGDASQVADASQVTDASPGPDAQAGACDPLGTPFGGTTMVSGVPVPLDMLCSAAHLVNIRTEPTGNFIQLADIDISGSVWAPIHDFQGSLVSNGVFTIEGLTIDDSVEDAPETMVAMFRHLSNGAILSGLRFTGASFSGDRGGLIAGVVRKAPVEDFGKPLSQFVNISNVEVEGTVTVTGATTGGLFRILSEGAFVTDVSFKGTVNAATGLSPTSNLAFGGLTWRALGGSQLTNVLFDGTINLPGHGVVGGLVAETTGGASAIDGCVFRGLIRGARNIGGLVANHTAGLLSDCRVEGAFEITDGLTGGMVGNNSTGGEAMRVYVSAVFSSIDVDAIHPNGAWVPSGPIIYDMEKLGFDSTHADDGFVFGLQSAEMVDPANSAWDNFASPRWSYSGGSLPKLDFED